MDTELFACQTRDSSEHCCCIWNKLEIRVLGVSARTAVRDKGTRTLRKIWRRVRKKVIQVLQGGGGLCGSPLPPRAGKAGFLRQISRDRQTTVHVYRRAETKLGQAKRGQKFQTLEVGRFHQINQMSVSSGPFPCSLNSYFWTRAAGMGACTHLETRVLGADVGVEPLTNGIR